jgi:hypothetical protein
MSTHVTLWLTGILAANRRGVAKPRQQDRQALVDTVAGAARCA